MCTAVVFSSPDGRLCIAFNRDEQRSRPIAAAPTIVELAAGTNAVFPADGQAGGTWIGANAHGLGLFLLNNYQGVSRQVAHAVTRGALIPALLDAPSRDGFEVLLRDQNAQIRRMQPFQLYAVWHGSDDLLCIRWSGEDLRDERTKIPRVAVSSSVMFDAADAHRRAQFAESTSREWTDDTLDVVFSGHLPARGPTSICMHRDDAKTVSHTRLWISATDVRMRYWPGPLCQTRNSIDVSLTRS
ncbi:MAG: NRDE family protein [bacterium]